MVRRRYHGAIRRPLRFICACCTLLPVSVRATGVALAITGDWGDCTADCVRSRVVFCASSTTGKLLFKDACGTLPSSVESCHWGDCIGAGTAAAAAAPSAPAEGVTDTTTAAQRRDYNAGASTNTTPTSEQKLTKRSDVMLQSDQTQSRRRQGTSGAGGGAGSTAITNSSPQRGQQTSLKQQTTTPGGNDVAEGSGAAAKSGSYSRPSSKSNGQLRTADVRRDYTPYDAAAAARAREAAAEMLVAATARSQELSSASKRAAASYATVTTGLAAEPSTVNPGEGGSVAPSGSAVDRQGGAAGMPALVMRQPQPSSLRASEPSITQMGVGPGGAAAQHTWMVVAAGAVAVGTFLGVVVLAVRGMREPQRRPPWENREEDDEWSYTRRDDGSSVADSEEGLNPFAAALSTPKGSQVELSVFKL